MKKIQIPPANDLHVHFRQDDDFMLRNVVPHSAKRCARTLVMPNTKIPVTEADHVSRDYKKIKELSGYMEPLLTIKVDANCTPEKVRAAHKAGAIAGKIYPEGVTTNSEGGITRDMFNKPPQQFLDTLAAMEETGMILCLHGEMPGHEVLDRELQFLPWVDWVLRNYKKIKVVLEHITDHHSVDMVRLDDSGRLAATITVHHLVYTLDDVIGDKLNPHAFCKPVAKRIIDRGALQSAAISGLPSFFLGTDSAPHLKGNKECSAGCAGVYTAPVMTEVLAGVFEQFDRLDKLEGFMTRFGEQFYGLPPVEGSITLEKESWRVPDVIDGVVPMHAGKLLDWRING
jgi:dihydroorotase